MLSSADTVSQPLSSRNLQAQGSNSKFAGSNMNKVFSKASDAATAASKKFTNVSVNRGKTAFPKAPKDLESLGIRFDFDGEIQRDGLTYNKFQVQPNSGKVPSGVRDWRDKNGGTHAVMGSLFVKKDGDADDVKTGFEDFEKDFKRYVPKLSLCHTY
jgi:hypothetical protein